MKNLEKFKQWLIDNGCDILPPTNQYEKLRFKGVQVGILYTTDRTSGKYADDAIKHFKSNKKWDGGAIKTGRWTGYQKEKKQLIKRDGTCCFYCGLEMDDDITVEHLLDLKFGGKNELSNMVLAHSICNQTVRHSLLVEKIKIAIENRSKQSNNH